ncbi:MAG: hypothetical protein ACUVUR_06960 [bacterium]
MALVIAQDGDDPNRSGDGGMGNFFLDYDRNGNKISVSKNKED